MIPDTYDFPAMVRADTFSVVTMTIEVNSVALDLTNYVIKMDLKRTAKDTTAIYTASTVNGRIVLTDPTNGVIDILTDTVIDIPPHNYVYDIEFTSPGGIVKTYVAGHWHILNHATQ